MKYENIPVFPGWEIVDEIGQGSFGCVYEIKKTEAYGNTEHSAMKTISIPSSQSEVKSYRDEGLDDMSITALFQSRMEDITAEFSLMSKLKGTSNIVSYEDHSVISANNGIGWDILIRMELLTALPDYLATRKAYDEAVTVRLAKDICSALMLCSRHNIIHRDIKPSNIFISKNGDFKLGDFGIAKTADHATMGTKTGTYNYMAPEVYNNRPYGANVDLYSLGMVLYWMMNERRGPFLPLPPLPPKANEWTKATERRMSGETLPAPKNGSEAMKAIVLKACAADPKQRFQTAAEMWEALNALQQGKPPVVVDPVEPEQTEEEKTEPDESTETGDGNLTVVDRTVTERRDEEQENPAELPEPEESPEPQKKKPKKGLLSMGVLVVLVLGIIAAAFGLSRSDGGNASEQLEVLEYAITEDVGLRYSIVDNEHAIILGFVYGDDVFGALELPDTIEGYPVKEIGQGAFYNKAGLRSVKLPESLEIIGTYAFQGCSSLETVDLPKSLKTIRREAFRDCVSLKSVTLPILVAVDEYAFRGCTGMTALTVNNGVELGKGVFMECTALETVVLSDTMKTIPTDTFVNCTALQSIKLPVSLTSLEPYAFSRSGLKSVALPNTLESISDYAFMNCTALETVSVGKSVSEIGIEAFRGCSSLQSVELPASVKSIESAAFRDCASLKKAVIGSATEIGGSVFKDCSALETLVLPENLTAIYKDAITGCMNLRNIYYAGSEEMWKHISKEETVNNVLAELAVNITYNSAGENAE